MLNLINLKMKEFEDDYCFLVESITPPPSHYFKFGTIPNFYKHGKNEQLLFDPPLPIKRVGLIIKRRYRCQECKETFFEDLFDIDASRSVLGTNLLK